MTLEKKYGINQNEVIEDKLCSNVSIDLYLDKEIIIRKRIGFILLSIFLLSAIIIAITYIYLNFDTIKLKLSPVEFFLKEESIEVNVGDKIDLNKYIIKGENVELELPEVNTNEIGKKSYTIKGKNSEKEKDLNFNISVVDKIPPILELKQDSVTIEEDLYNTINLKDYIGKYEDNYTKNLEVKIEGDVQKSRDINDIKYTVEDESGNKTERILKVYLKRKPVEVVVEKPAEAPKPAVEHKPAPAPAPVPTTKPSRNYGTQPVQNQKPVQASTGGQKDFLFTSGYNIDSGFDACVAEGSKYKSYSCTDIKNSKGIVIGYRLKYK